MRKLKWFLITTILVILIVANIWMLWELFTAYRPSPLPESVCVPVEPSPWQFIPDPFREPEIDNG